MASKLSISDKLSALFTAQAKASSEFRRDISQLESELAAARNRLSDLRNAPVALPEIERRVDQFLLDEEAEARRDFAPSNISAHDGNAGSTYIADVLAKARTNIGALVILGFRDQIREALISEAGSSCIGDAISEDDRSAEIKRLIGEIQKLEKIREKINRLAEEQGVSVPRSEFADPAALLAKDKDL
ncbi:hypothetical protein J5277_16420 [Rhizobium sp. 16-449-1b]|uniref:hypothetical protein n=1 Tax=Rhizobium sp. 16-449-1b TaxID=2819989 RepID=UPI001ADA8F13|nr:hypothetical protein [Rhizobium sp. 16-449-1b]MBO9195692.1 hypothetical protein [Rhizobium sp. 16-449-1b]